MLIVGFSLSSTDLTRLYPLHKIREEAERQKDILGPKNIQQKYETISKGKNWLSGTLTRSKGKGDFFMCNVCA